MQIAMTLHKAKDNFFYDQKTIIKGVIFLTYLDYYQTNYFVIKTVLCPVKTVRTRKVQIYARTNIQTTDSQN